MVRRPARSTIRAVVFTIEQRDALRDRVLTLAERDRRIAAPATASPTSTSHSRSPTVFPSTPFSTTGPAG
jgi:hypothetical protein